MSDCERKGKFFGGCHFVARYDEIPPSFETLEGMKTTVHGAEMTFRALTKTIYVKDVCTRCGKDVKRQSGDHK